MESKKIFLVLLILTSALIIFFFPIARFDSLIFKNISSSVFKDANLPGDTGEKPNILKDANLPGDIGEKPNVIIINIDTLRADHVGAYGYSKNTTPFLDSLFKQGVIFDNAITPGYLTPQTDAAIFSGLYPSQNNVSSWGSPINDKLVLLPKILSLYGYRTGAFVCEGLEKNFGFDKQFDTYNYYAYDYQNEFKNATTSRADIIKWITETKSPFFIFWHIYDVHFPYIKPDNEFYKKDYRGIFSYKTSVLDMVRQSTTKIEIRAINGATSSKEVTEEDVDFLKASYDSGIKYVDEQLRIFFDQIKNSNLYNNTIFIISSEHGEDLKEHSFIFHRDLYDVNTRVPLVIIAPHISYLRIKEAVSSLDIMPTILQMVGGVVPQNIEGKSLAPFFSGDSIQRDIFTERPPFDEYSIRRGDWKYILRNPNKKNFTLPANSNYDKFMQTIVVNDIDGGDELYNISNDPKEQDNLIGKGFLEESELRKVVTEFRVRMQKARYDNNNVKKISPANVFIPYP
jgi:arylsulfatase A-like enzyme